MPDDRIREGLPPVPVPSVKKETSGLLVFGIVGIAVACALLIWGISVLARYATSPIDAEKKPAESEPVEFILDAQQQALCDVRLVHTGPKGNDGKISLFELLGGRDGTIHNNNDGIRLTKLNIKVQTKDWVRIYAADVNVAPFKTGTFGVTTHEQSVVVEKFNVESISGVRVTK